MNSEGQINSKATKKEYHKPNVQVYGTLAQMTATSAGVFGGALDVGGNTNKSRT